MERADRYSIHSMTSDEIYEQYHRLVAKVARSYTRATRGDIPFEDFFQAGMERLFGKLPSYDPEISEFTTFIMPWLQQAMQKAAYKYSDLTLHFAKYYPPGTFTVFSVDGMKSPDGESQGTPYDWFPGTSVHDPIEERVIFKDALEKALAGAKGHEEWAFFRYFEHHEGLREIGERMNRSHQSASNYMAAVTKSLRDHMEWAEEDAA